MAKSVNGERDKHGESGGCEPPMPAGFLAYCADHKRPCQTGEVHCEKVELEPFDASGVGVVERPQLAGDCSAKQANAERNAG